MTREEKDRDIAYMAAASELVHSYARLINALREASPLTGNGSLVMKNVIIGAEKISDKVVAEICEIEQQEGFNDGR